MITHVVKNGTYIITVNPSTEEERALIDLALKTEKGKANPVEKSRQMTLDDFDNAWKPITKDNPFNMDGSPIVEQKKNKFSDLFGKR